MENNDYLYENEVPKRPSFLTVLCILTFIGSGWAILSSVWSYRTAGVTSKEFTTVINVQKDSTVMIQKDSTVKVDTVAVNDSVNMQGRREVLPLEQKMKASFSKMLTKDNIEMSAIGNFLAALLTLAGALMMWNLRRWGFYLYILGVLVGIAIPFYIYGDNFLAVGLSSFGNFFGLIFIALYALNIKSMYK